MPRASTVASLSLLAVLVVSAPHAAWSSTLISISGTGDLQLSTTGNLYFDTRDLRASQIDLRVDSTIRTGLPAFAYPTTPDTRASYAGISGPTVLDFSDDVFIVGFTFQGTLNMRAANMFVVGTLGSTGNINIGTGQPGPPLVCDPGGGAVLTRGSAAGVIQIGGCVPGIVINPPPISIGPPPVIVAATPEPGSAVLFVVGLLLVGSRVRGQR